MSIARLLSNAGLFVIEDSQAKHRKSKQADVITLSFIDEEDILQAVSVASNSYPAPLVLIINTGQVMVLSNQSKTGIALQGTETTLTDAQKASLATVSKVLGAHYGVSVKTLPKKRAQSTAPAEEVVEQPASEDAPSTEE